MTYIHIPEGGGSQWPGSLVFAGWTRAHPCDFIIWYQGVSFYNKILIPNIVVLSIDMQLAIDNLAYWNINLLVPYT